MNMTNQDKEESKVEHEPILELYRADTSTAMPLPYADEGIRAGFPSPAQDYIETSLDLNKLVVHDKTSTFYARVKGTSLIKEGIDDGDILVIDVSIGPQDGDLCACYIDGEFTAKRLKILPDRALLMPANDDFEPIEVTAEDNFRVWGVVTYHIKKITIQKV
jgi:DNA polymerase V